MEFKDIDDLLFKINKVFAYRHNVDFGKSESKILKQGKERKALLYLKDDLGLIKELFYSTEEVTYTLTLKGNEVVVEGGWKKYSEKQKSKKLIEKRKKEFSYWIGIIIPFMMLLVSIWIARNENFKKQDMLDKEFQQQEEIIKNEVDKRIEMLTKKMDSVLQMSDKNK